MKIVNVNIGGFRLAAMVSFGSRSNPEIAEPDDSGSATAWEGLLFLILAAAFDCAYLGGGRLGQSPRLVDPRRAADEKVSRSAAWALRTSEEPVVRRRPMGVHGR